MKKNEVINNRVLKEIITERAINSLLCCSAGTEKMSDKDKILIAFYKKAIKQTAGCSLAGGLKKLPSNLDGKKLKRRCKNIADDGTLERVDLSSDFFTISDKFILSEIVSLLNDTITCVYCGASDEFYFYDRAALKPYGLFIKSEITDLKKVTSLNSEVTEIKIKNSFHKLWNETTSSNYLKLSNYLKQKEKEAVSA